MKNGPAPGRPFQRRTLGHSPTAHTAGAQGNFVNAMGDGACVYWKPRFDFDDFLKHCRELENMLNVTMRLGSFFYAIILNGCGD